MPKWGSGSGDNGGSNRLQGRVSDGRDGRILGNSNSRGHGGSERGPQNDSYNGFLMDGEDHLPESYCQVELRSEISDSEVIYYLAPFSRSSVTTAQCLFFAASESGVCLDIYFSELISTLPVSSSSFTTDSRPFSAAYESGV